MIMNIEKEMKYEAPEMEVLEVEIELGFAGSDTSGGVPPIEIPD
ncbi:hypothetical protein [Bacteroides rodentium]